MVGLQSQMAEGGVELAVAGEDEGEEAAGPGQGALAVVDVFLPLVVQDLFRLRFVHDKAFAVLIGGVGLGKTHLAIALGHAACEAGLRVRFTTAIGMVNTLGVAHSAGRFAAELKKYTRPQLLVIDELGHLPLDKRGAELLFQVISERYERGAVVLTTNKTFKHWPSIFNNDTTLTSALLDRVVHHSEVVVIEGKSYRMKDRIDP